MGWVYKAKWALGAGGILIALTLLVGWADGRRVEGPIVEARVTHFGTNPSRWHPDRMTVVAATPDGKVGHGMLTLDQIEALDCKAGSPVDARMVGAVLVVDAATCGRRGFDATGYGSSGNLPKNDK